MTDTLRLDENYSTTRLVTKEKPIFRHLTEANACGAQLPSLSFPARSGIPTALQIPGSSPRMTQEVEPEGEGRRGEGGLRRQGYFKKSYEGKNKINFKFLVTNAF